MTAMGFNANQKEQRENIFKDMPPHGTVLGTVSTDCCNELQKLNDQINALEACRSGSESLVRLYGERRRLWLKISHQYGFPYAWSVTLDYGSGKLYINQP